MIYVGTAAFANGTSVSSPITMTFHNATGDNAYVGYMRGTIGATTYAATHANTTNSAVKTYLESTWYYRNILNTDYEQYVVDAIYCNDRAVSSGTGIGSTYTDYAAKQRILIDSTNSQPTLKCNQLNDRFTVNSMIENFQGNAKLTYPIGLITADEVVMAGGLSGTTTGTSNKTFYLYTGSDVWMMTPSSFSSISGNISVYAITTQGRISGVDIFDEEQIGRGVRPVISISPNAIQYGTGSSTDPFRLTSAI